MANWTIRNVKANIEEMSIQFNISKVFATILANRNMLTRRAINTYLYNDERYLYDCLDMKDMEVSFAFIIETIAKGERVCIYGDYDVDGITSTVILYKGLKKIGVDVIYYIPDREEEGYGLNTIAIDNVKEKGVDFILTCDNGIASVEEVKYIKENNMKIIILDHHEPKFIEENGERFEVLPMADAIINPKQKECKYKFKALSAGGISFKFIKGLYEYMDIDENFDEYLVFASISIICDIVDLVDENRIIAKNGIKILNKNKDINKGLSEMMKVNSIYNKEIDENDYGFIIGPCINASGRLESALKAVQLFTTENEDIISKLAMELLELNKERKDLTYKAVEEISFMIEDSLVKNDKVLVAYHEGIHESIAGIVAGKIKEIYYKPTFIITKCKEGAKGSGRSIPSYNMFEELLKCEHLFKKFGGHKMAAGLSLEEVNIDKFRELINKNCNLKDNDFIETISIDKSLKFSEININMAEELHKMKPLGKENKGAIFATKNVSIKNIRFVGKEKRILQLLLYDETLTNFNSIDFNNYDKFIKILEDNLSKDDLKKVILGVKKNIDLKLDVVYSIEVNIFNNLKNVQLILKDFRLA